MVIKRSHLINLIENQKEIFRAPKISDDARHVVWGELMAFKYLLEDDVHLYDHNDLIEYVWDHSWTSGEKPHDFFNWLYDCLRPSVTEEE